MDYYYPDRIAEDDISSCGSAEIALHPMRHKIQSTSDAYADGGISSVRRIDDDNDDDNSLLASSDGRHGGTGESHDEKGAPKSSRGEGLGTNHNESNAVANDLDEQNYKNMAALIKNERNRRLGVREHADADNGQAHPPPSSNELPAPSNPVGVLGNIRGWFGVGGSAVVSRQSFTPVSHTQNNYSSHHLHRCAPLQKNTPPRAEYSQIARKTSSSDNSSSSTSSDETSTDDDDYSSSQSSDASYPKHGNANLTPQERARARALRYLSDSCVDAGRKAKTASYVRSLERLDLKRRRDRYEKELEIVEAEMNKDRGLINDGEDRDVILTMAAVLAWEVPQGSADTGAGSGLGEEVTGSESFMTYEEYADTMAKNANGLTLNCDTYRQHSLWENNRAVEIYVCSLQSRLKDAQERTRSLEKRLVVLELAGDDIISSLCEDLAEVTGHSNKVEACYVKKGKELKRKRRREEFQHRSKIKQAEMRVRRLEERLLYFSGDQNLQDQIIGATTCDTSNEDSTSSGNDDENDEVLLEKKLSAIKAKNEQDKIQHESEVDSIRRQCEQLKLRLSVGRLVMEGDDNIHEYMALLERQRKNCTIDNFIDRDFSGIDGVPIPAPPLHITRARAKLLKIVHLECIYQQRLSVSKAFTDATINALDQELIERESASQKMEVRCLNELLVIDSEIKDIVKEASDKLSELMSEAHELENAILACVAQNQIADIGDLFAVHKNLIDPLKRENEDIIAANDETSCGMLINRKNELRQFEVEEESSDLMSPADDGIADDQSATLMPETSLPVCEEDKNDEQLENNLIPDADVKFEYDIADKMSLPQDACHNSCDSIVKYPHSDASCLEFDMMKDDNGEKTSGDISVHEKKAEISSSPQMAKINEPDGAFQGLSGASATPKQAFTGLVEDNSVDSDISIFEEKRTPTLFANNQNAAIDASDVSKNTKNLPILDLPHDKTDVKVYPDHNDKHCDERGETLSAVEYQKEAVLQSLGRELNCTLAEYQTSYDLSTSSDRIEQLNYMNDLVVAIAKLSGLRLEHANETATDQLELKSWSYKKPHRTSKERDDHERNRSKKKKKTKRRRGIERNAKSKDGLDHHSGPILKISSEPDSLQNSLVW